MMNEMIARRPSHRGPHSTPRPRVAARDMIRLLTCPPSRWLGAALLALLTLAQPATQAFISEGEFEFLATGDFDADGRPDVVIVDKLTGRYRVGYQKTPGALQWANVRSSKIPNVTGFTVGRLLDAKKDALAFTAPEANQINVVDASDPATGAEPVVMLPATLGPEGLVAVDIGGDGNTPLDDLYVNTVYNTPDPYRLDLLRNTGSEANAIGDFDLSGDLKRPSRVVLKTGGAGLVSSLLRGEKSNTLRVDSVRSGKPETVLTIPDLSTNAVYVAGRFGDSAMATFLLYLPGETNLTAYPVEEAGGKFQVTAPRALPMEKSIRQAFVLGEGQGARLVLTFGNGESGSIYKFDGTVGLSEVQALQPPPAEFLSGVAALGDKLLVTTARPRAKSSSSFWMCPIGDPKLPAAAGADLPTVEETVLAIRALILANLKEKDVSEMKAYTNVIPGTKVTYAMVPIPGGEFLMGSPASEPGRKPDEGPQHKVRLDPFWMGQFEVSWNEFELFMYPDEERKYRDSAPTDTEVDKVSDGVTRPTKPYVEMSFGMGKDGYPAIAMTHHGANKYCQWLSAKTGHFYRLPTEAEWEYACRAGTTTAYSFGDDPATLGEYAWFEDNSDFKYQKIDKKKPNPWGLYDIHGNVLEWCLDQYVENYDGFTEPVTVNPWVRATRPYPHVTRGGDWDDPAAALRSAARRGSDRTWKMTDPQLPKSTWWLSDAKWVGFRLVRPLKVPSPEQLSKYWTSGTERD
jgi:formylglycine-generating enzyme required for sulfatase activity